MKMQKHINGAVYLVDFKGKTNSEFKGDHPAIVIQTAKYKTLYYVIPLTTYTKERWDKYKKEFGCRIKSTESIALVAKMEVMHASKIKGRSVSNNFSPPRLLVPTPEEIDCVTKKLISYMDTAVLKTSKAYNEFHAQYTTFDITCLEIDRIIAEKKVNTEDFFSIFKSSDASITLKFEDKSTATLSHRDVEYIIGCHTKSNFTINYYDDHYLAKFTY